MVNIVDSFKNERLRLFDGLMFTPLFETPSYSSYHDSVIDRQITIALSGIDTNRPIYFAKMFDISSYIFCIRRICQF